ncbi:hypothetical protein HK101_007918 [Irineochytrium annulatum]|nr:hypothetical protein HK101_007918 [Irineochytrium annulatum]
MTIDASRRRQFAGTAAALLILYHLSKLDLHLRISLIEPTPSRPNITYGQGPVVDGADAASLGIKPQEEWDWAVLPFDLPPADVTEVTGVADVDVTAFVDVTADSSSSTADATTAHHDTSTPEEWTNLSPDESSTVVSDCDVFKSVPVDPSLAFAKIRCCTARHAAAPQRKYTPPYEAGPLRTAVDVVNLLRDRTLTLMGDSLSEQVYLALLAGLRMQSDVNYHPVRAMNSTRVIPGSRPGYSEEVPCFWAPLHIPATNTTVALAKMYLYDEDGVDLPWPPRSAGVDGTEHDHGVSRWPVRSRAKMFCTKDQLVWVAERSDVIAFNLGAHYLGSADKVSIFNDTMTSVARWLDMINSDPPPSPLSSSSGDGVAPLSQRRARLGFMREYLPKHDDGNAPEDGNDPATTGTTCSRDIHPDPHNQIMAEAARRNGVPLQKCADAYKNRTEAHTGFRAGKGGGYDCLHWCFNRFVKGLRFVQKLHYWLT